MDDRTQVPQRGDLYWGSHLIDPKQYDKPRTALLRVDASTSDDILTSLPRSGRNGRAGREPLRREYGAIQSDPHSGSFTRVAEIFCWLPSAQERSAHVLEPPHIKCREFSDASTPLERYLMSEAAPKRIPPALRRGAVLCRHRQGRDPAVHVVVSSDAANRYRWLRTRLTRFVSVVRVQWTAIPKPDDEYEPISVPEPGCARYKATSNGSLFEGYLDTLCTISVDPSRSGWRMDTDFRMPTGSYQRLNPQLLELLVTDIRHHLGMVKP